MPSGKVIALGQVGRWSGHRWNLRLEVGWSRQECLYIRPDRVHVVLGVHLAVEDHSLCPMMFSDRALDILRPVLASRAMSSSYWSAWVASGWVPSHCTSMPRHRSFMVSSGMP